MSTERTLKLYKSTVRSIQVIGPTGKYIYFKDGMYATDFPDEVAYLDQLIAERNPHIYQDADKEITSTVYADPLAEIKKKAVAEYLAALEKKDFGSTSPTPVTNQGGVVNSEKIAALTKK